jgi:hypothetical protein
MARAISHEHATETSMPIDIERARRDTPAASQLLHFNNAGAALMPAPVVQAQLRHLQLETDTGGYEAAAAAHDRIEAIYDSIARLLNADRAEIALVENATVAWDMAFYSVGFVAGDRILTAEAEYASNYIAFLQVARRTGAVVDVVPSDEAGELDLVALERMIDRRVKLIAITHVPTNGRPRQSGDGDRSHRPRPRHSLPARRLPIRGPDADRRRRDRLRHVVHDRAEVSARAPRDRIPLRAAGRPRRAGAALSRSAGGDLGRGRSLRDAPGRPPLRELGT